MYGAITSNDEYSNNVYIVRFKYVPYTPQEDVESDGNQLVSGDPVFNAIYKYPGRHKSQFYVEPYKNKKCYCINERSCYFKYRC